MPAENHAAAVKEILNRIDGVGDIALAGPSGGPRRRSLCRATLIDDDVISGIEELDELAPLHNASAGAVIRASRAVLDRSIPQVAVFDTAFHRTIPDHARYYALPWEITKRYGIQRFGFHGISHNYLVLRYAELTQTPLERTNIITLHLEGGSSAAGPDEMGKLSVRSRSLAGDGGAAQDHRIDVCFLSPENGWFDCAHLRTCDSGCSSAGL